MPTIKHEVRTARKNYQCNKCDRHISKGEQYEYLYGMPDLGDKPYPIRYCDKCGIQRGEII